MASLPASGMFTLTLSLFAMGCLHEPNRSFREDVRWAGEEADESVVVREIVIGGAEPTDSAPAPPVVPASAWDLPKPDPVPFRLGAGYGPAEWTPAFADMELAEPMRTWRQDRLSQPRTAELRPARPPAPWRPGRPLPGSWLGTR